MKVGCITPRMFACRPAGRKLFLRTATKDAHTNFTCVGARALTAANYLSARHWYGRPPHAPSAAYSDEFRQRFRFSGASISDSNVPQLPFRFRHPLSKHVSARHLRRVVHGGVRVPLATNARPSRWATRVQRPRCVPSPALSSLSQARSMSAMCRTAGACVEIAYGSSRPVAVVRHGQLYRHSLASSKVPVAASTKGKNRFPDGLS